jgi:hypothetical protein
MRRTLLCLAAVGLLAACQERAATGAPEEHPPHGDESLHYRSVDEAHQQADETLRDLGAKPPIEEDSPP